MTLENVKKLSKELLESKPMLHLVLDHISIRVFWKDCNLRYLGCNRAFAKDIGLSHPDDIIGLTDDDLHWKDYAPNIQKDDHEVLTSQKEKLSYEGYAQTADGKVITIEMSKVPFLDASHNIIGLIGIYEDVTEKRISQSYVATEREVLRTTLTSIGEGVISTDKKGHITLINQTAEEMTGWTQHEAMGQHVEEVFRLDCLNKHQLNLHPVEHVLHFKTPIAEESEHMLISKQNKKLLVEYSVSPIKNNLNQIQGTVLVFRDYSEKKEKLDKISNLSYFDQLTQVYNRRFYEEELDRLNTKENLPLTIALFDLNGLKLINDAFGHEAGDKALQIVANAMQKSCRKNDVVARIGGDEFVMLLPKTSSFEAKNLLEYIHKIIIAEKVESIQISASFGWHTKLDLSEEISEIFRIAEDHMYSLKLSQTATMRTQAVDVIMKTLFEKNPLEEQHGQRVSYFAVKMGTKLKMTDQEINRLRVAGTMHDIGKIVVDENILKKNSPLTESEMLEVHRHPAVGYRILKSISAYEPLANIIFAHHERWDGTGYPRRLAGEAIPLMSRIIAIAEVFDVLTVGRANKPARSFEEAIKEIKLRSGSQFDPKLVDLFIEILESSNDIETIDFARYNALKKKVIELSESLIPQFPKKDNLPTSADQFLKDHGFSGYTLTHSKNRILYYGCRSYIPLRAMDQGESCLPWSVVQPYTANDEKLMNVGLYIDGTISTVEPRGTGAMYHNTHNTDIVVFSKDLYGYQGYRWGYYQYGVIRIDQNGLIVENIANDQLDIGTNITLHPGDFLLTLFEADRLALGGAEYGFAQNPYFKVGQKVLIEFHPNLVYYGR